MADELITVLDSLREKRLLAAASIMAGAIKRNVPEGTMRLAAFRHLQAALVAAIEGVRLSAACRAPAPSGDHPPVRPSPTRLSSDTPGT
jgi:hypothetical protein